MTSYYIVALSSVAVLAVIAALWYFCQWQSLRVREAGSSERSAAQSAEIERLRGLLEAAQLESRALRSDIQSNREQLAAVKVSLEMERKQADEKLQLLNESRDQLSAAFKNIANEIFEDKTRKFTATSKDSLEAVLSPLKDKISQFEKRVEDTYDKESKERFSLAREIKSLQELNSRISEDAVNLTNALKGDNKTQGNWGEFVLESILERSGLTKGREYEVQVSLQNAEGSKSQPDVIVHLPEQRDIIIDAKVSLKAWDGFCASEGDDSAEWLKQHLQSLRLHVKNLASKDYQNLAGINSLDYVFLFMPIEAAYSTAIQHDPELFQFAFERNIIFVVPSTLLTTLKTVQNLWRLSQQNKNANEIAERAGALYDKFVAFVDDMEEVGQRIDASRNSLENARNKLVSGRGNLIRRTEMLRQLGAKTSKRHKPEVLNEAMPEQRSLLDGDAGASSELVAELEDSASS